MVKLKKQTGFTIVELLIVIVVIAILAAITIVAYNGITNQAKDAAVKSNLSQYAKKLEAARALSPDGAYPADLSSTGIVAPSDVEVTYGTTLGGKGYCVDFTSFSDDEGYLVTSDSSISRRGSCGPMNGLVAWWPLNGDARDISGNGLNGQATNVTPVQNAKGEENAALSFNGSTSQILCGTSSLIRPTDGVTITAWIYLPSAPSGTVGILNNGTQGYSLSVNTSRRLVFNTQNTDFVLGTSMNTGGWYSVYARYDTGRKKIGQNDSTGSGNFSSNGTIGTGTLSNYGSDVCQIGSIRNAAGTFFNGRIDDVRIYNRALSDAELSSIGSPY